MRVAVVGGGLAGALLAWRLCRASKRVAVEVFTAEPAGEDATSASGGLVRGFERGNEACRLAAESLAELRADATLRESSAYQEVGSVYVLPPGCDPTEPVRLVDERLPGSVALLTGADVEAAYPFHGLPTGTVAVAERHAGYLSPAALRAAALSWLASPVRRVPVTAVLPQPALRLADGGTRGYDAVVLAAGAWTPAVLAASGLESGRLTTRQIQYSVYPARLPLGAFVDDTTGLYGRPAGDGAFLLGLPCERWGVEPASVRPDAGLVERVAVEAHTRLGVPAPGDVPHRTVASFDCYHDPPGLALREVVPGAALFTFTGGSGGAAKTVLAASRAAASALLGR
jgi:glycine/D-amino acid oxidase-like deaminating enzyme